MSVAPPLRQPVPAPDPPARFAGTFDQFSATEARRPLRTYQRAAARAILDSVARRDGETFVVMLARQMGKNELSAQVEAWLLDQHSGEGGTIVKAAPTFRPQLHTSIARLAHTLSGPRYAGKVLRRHGYRVQLGRAEAVFLSAAPYAHVQGATASLLLEVDEAQDVDPDKYARDFRPMAAASAATTVLYGTAWTPDTLLEQQRAVNDEKSEGDGRPRNFVFDWHAGAAENGAYGRFVQAEIARMGEGHPLIRTQYLLLPLDSAGKLFDRDARALMQGTHERQSAPAPGATYVAAIDVAGGVDDGAFTLRQHRDNRDTTVVGIAQVVPQADGGHPLTRLVEVYAWHGRALHEQTDRLIHLLREHWKVRRATIDASGLGAEMAGRLGRALGAKVADPVAFSVQSKSRLAYNLLAHVNAGRLQVFAENPASLELANLWREVSNVRPIVRPGNLLGFAAPPGGGHDDYVAMLALLAWSAKAIAAPPPSLVLRSHAAYSARYWQAAQDGRY